MIFGRYSRSQPEARVKDAKSRIRKEASQHHAAYYHGLGKLGETDEILD